MLKALALLTEEIQAERRRENEATLRRFQHEVQHRVAQQVQLHRKKQQLPVKIVKYFISIIIRSGQPADW